MNLSALWELKVYADDIGVIYLGIVLVASIIVKWTPTIKDDAVLLKIIKFMSKWIALNRTVKDKEIRKQLQKQIDKGVK